MSPNPDFTMWIGEEDFDVGPEYESLCESAPKSGAIVFFVGLVRDLYADQLLSEKVDHIYLEHYPKMTEALCQDILEQAHERFSYDYAKVLHRVGKLSAGEQIVMVGVASRNRENAFDAAQFIMDYLKTKATFWKKEVGSRGEQWLGVKQKDRDAELRWSKER